MAGELSTRLAARLEKARRKLATAKRLLAEGDLEDAAGRAYYAMYHAPHAALLPKRASPRTHKGLAMMLSTPLGGLDRVGGIPEDGDAGNAGDGFPE